MLPSHNSWRTAKVNRPALNLPFFISSIVGLSLPAVCERLEANSRLSRRVPKGHGAALQQRGSVLGHRCALEEAWALRAPQPHGVAEDEVVKIALGDEPVLDQLERLGERVTH